MAYLGFCREEDLRYQKFKFPEERGNSLTIDNINKYQIRDQEDPSSHIPLPVNSPLQ